MATKASNFFDPASFNAGKTPQKSPRTSKNSIVAIDPSSSNSHCKPISARSTSSAFHCAFIRTNFGDFAIVLDPFQMTQSQSARKELCETLKLSSLPFRLKTSTTAFHRCLLTQRKSGDRGLLPLIGDHPALRTIAI